jgi:hypothetical protein
VNDLDQMLLKGRLMSAGKLYQEMYHDVCKELNATRNLLLEEIHQERLRVIALEGQRMTLLSHLEIAANLLTKFSPTTASRLHGVVENLRNAYEAAPPKVAVLPTCEARRVDGLVQGPARSADNTSLYAQTGTDQERPF